jgi:hypothetical protein
LLLEPIRALRLGGVEQRLLRLGAAGLQVVERVLVGFQRWSCCAASSSTAPPSASAATRA